MIEMVQQLSGIGAAIAPQSYVDSAIAAKSASTGFSSDPNAVKPKYVLHKAPEVTCESCQ
jgi:hypothetical protein